MSIFSRFKRASNPKWVDATRIYKVLMTQSRNPQFYGSNRVPDSYEGRIEILTWHVAQTIWALRQHSEQGERLSQALFDVMVEDFDQALREEGLTDTGVSHRIKPMVRLFYTRATQLEAAMDDPHPEAAFRSALVNSTLSGMSERYVSQAYEYMKSLKLHLASLTLGQIAKGSLSFPDINVD